MNFVKRAYNLLVGERTAEVKMTIGSAIADEEETEIRAETWLQGFQDDYR